MNPPGSIRREATTGGTVGIVLAGAADGLATMATSSAQVL
jgi:hypothetical protein